MTIALANILAHVFQVFVWGQRYPRVTKKRIKDKAQVGFAFLLISQINCSTIYPSTASDNSYSIVSVKVDTIYNFSFSRLWIESARNLTSRNHN